MPVIPDMNLVIALLRGKQQDALPMDGMIKPPDTGDDMALPPDPGMYGAPPSFLNVAQKKPNG